MLVPLNPSFYAINQSDFSHIHGAVLSLSSTNIVLEITYHTYVHACC
jgi:hypothetical protein